jgi:hypothetical protein
MSTPFACLGISVSISSAFAEPALGRDGFLAQDEKEKNEKMMTIPITDIFFILFPPYLFTEILSLWFNHREYNRKVCGEANIFWVIKKTVL